MARPAADDEETPPLDPGLEKVRRKLIRFMAVNLGLIFLALMVVIAALVYKSRTRTPAPSPVSEIPAPAGAPVSGDIVLPVGAKIVSQSISGDRIAIDAELADGSRAIFVYDIAEKRMIGRYTLRTQ